MLNYFKSRLNVRNAGMLVAVITVVVGLYVHARTASEAAVRTKVRSATETQDQRPPNGIHLPKQKVDDLIVLELSRFGFMPAEITRRKGHLIISVTNRTGIGELALQLQRADGERLREFHLTTERPRLREEIDLPAGEYVLTEANHPEWVCRITIGDK